jgi:hypothetical protein
MKISFSKTLNYFLEKPRSLFLIDGLGAALTAFSLFFVLRPFNDWIGLPTIILSNLAVIGLVFCTYSLSCFFLIKNNWSPYLKIIGWSNFLYCLLTLLIIRYFFNSLTGIGLSYFLVEISIIISLVIIELSVAKRLRIKKKD